MLINKSGREPLGHAILMIPYIKDFHKKESKIVLPDSYDQTQKSIETRMIILEIGPESWTSPGQKPRAKVGDKVMVSKYAGSQVMGEDGKIYRMVNANDVFCRIHDEVDIIEFMKATGYYHE